jgi:hypothetical protein
LFKALNVIHMILNWKESLGKPCIIIALLMETAEVGHSPEIEFSAWVGKPESLLSIV